MISIYCRTCLTNYQSSSLFIVQYGHCSNSDPWENYSFSIFYGWKVVSCINLSTTFREPLLHSPFQLKNSTIAFLMEFVKKLKFPWNWLTDLLTSRGVRWKAAHMSKDYKTRIGEDLSSWRLHVARLITGKSGISKHRPYEVIKKKLPLLLFSNLNTSISLILFLPSLFLPCVLQ